MIKPMRNSLICLLALAMLLGLSGCFFFAAENEAAPSQPAVSETPEPEIMPGGTLYIPMPQNPSSINPIKVNTREMADVMSLVFESTVNLDQNNRIVPGLAETWEPDETGRVWRFTIRKDVRWHGAPDDLTAEDIVFTYETIKEMGEQESMYASELGVIEMMRAESPYTLIVEAKEPGYSALYAMRFPVMSKDHYKSDIPIGTGPYRIKTYQPLTGMELGANDLWWRQPPLIKTVIARTQVDHETALAAISLKQLNFVPSSLITAGRYRVIGEIETQDIMTQQCEMLLPRMNNAILSDVRVRKAIALALDRREIIAKVYLNHAMTCDVPVPPDSWLYDLKFKAYDQDVAQAKTLLDEAGWKDRDGDGILDKREGTELKRLSLKLLVNETPEAPERAETGKFIRDQLLKVGIEIEIIPRKWSSEVNEYAQALEAGNFDLALVGIFLGYNADLQPIIGTDGICNYGKYHNTSMDELIAASQRAVSVEGVQEAYMSLQQKIVDELPVITLYFHTGLVLYDARIAGIKDIRDREVFRTVEKWYFVQNAAQEQ